jgi:hypothetical protein
MLGTLGREMREIQILADAESPPDDAPVDGSLHVKNGGNSGNGGNDDTSHASTITQATFNSYDDDQATFNSSAAGQPMFDYDVGQATFNADVSGFEALGSALRQHMGSGSSLPGTRGGFFDSPFSTNSK